jgi:hypothetical protein
MFKFIIPMLLLSMSSFAILPPLTAVYNLDKNVVLLKWHNGQAGVNTFTIQRSDNSKNFTDIALQQATANIPDQNYSFTDNQPPAGENYYRLKVVNADGTTEYSATVMVINGNTGKDWVMYPVPVTDLLTLQYRGIAPIKGVINVFIQTMSGKILFRLRAASSTRTIKIPVDNLGKAIYDIRIIIENEIVWNQRFVK